MRHRLTRTLAVLAAFLVAATTTLLGAGPAQATYGQFLYNDARLDDGPTVHAIYTNVDVANPAWTPGPGGVIDGYVSQYTLLRNTTTGAYVEVGVFKGAMPNSYPTNGYMGSGITGRLYWCDYKPGQQRWCHAGPVIATSTVTIYLNAAPFAGGVEVYMNGTYDFSTYLQSDGGINQALMGLKSSDWRLPASPVWKSGRFFGGLLARNAWGNPYADYGWQSIDNMNSGAANNTSELQIGWPNSNNTFYILGA